MGQKEILNEILRHPKGIPLAELRMVMKDKTGEASVSRQCRALFSKGIILRTGTVRHTYYPTSESAKYLKEYTQINIQ